jgi:hypothetical protein
MNTTIDSTISGRAFRLAINVFTAENGRGPWMPEEREECRRMAEEWIAKGNIKEL